MVSSLVISDVCYEDFAGDDCIIYTALHFKHWTNAELSSVRPLGANISDIFAPYMNDFSLKNFAIRYNWKFFIKIVKWFSHTSGSSIKQLNIAGFFLSK